MQPLRAMGIFGRGGVYAAQETEWVSADEGHPVFGRWAPLDIMVGGCLHECSAPVAAWRYGRWGPLGVSATGVQQVMGHWEAIWAFGQWVLQGVPTVGGLKSVFDRRVRVR